MTYTQVRIDNFGEAWREIYLVKNNPFFPHGTNLDTQSTFHPGFNQTLSIVELNFRLVN